MKSQRKKRNLVLTLFLAGVLATATFAFTASNTVGDHDAGDGQGAVSGFVVSNIVYDEGDDITDPASVSFDLDKPASSVKAGPADDLVTCTGGPTAWTCNLNVSLEDLDELRVVAY